MISKFNKLNDEYNSQMEYKYNQNVTTDNHKLLDFDDDIIFTMIKQAKSDIKLMNTKNTVDMSGVFHI